ncbi:MAG: Site-specific recombinase, phage integrase family domain protein [Verrucomicrobiaceae bacterium]|nr:Site-specific recombinase, phage integrase family domain protein [Verrucomicrobiaceae bacterium]
MDSMKVFLPEELESFLDRGEVLITADSSPSWLVTNFSAECWQIKIPGLSYFSENKWHRTLLVDWALKLPGGFLTHGRWARLLTHVKLLAVASLEAPNATATTPRSLETFCNHLMALCEHLIIHYLDQVAEEGLSFITPTEIERFCADHIVMGIAGTGAWLHRLRNFFRSLLNLKGQEFIFTKTPTLITTNKTFPAREFLIEGLDESEIDEVVVRLRQLNWFSSAGKISFSKIAHAIDVDFSRIGRSKLRLNFFLEALEIRNLSQINRLNSSSRRAKVSVRQHTALAQVERGITQSSQRILFDKMCDLPNFAKSISSLKDSPLAQADFFQISLPLHGGTRGRTPTLPMPIALLMYDRMLNWVLNYTAPLFEYVGEIVVQYRSMPRARYGVNEAKAFKENPIPHNLQPLGIDQFATAANRKNAPRNFWTEPQEAGIGAEQYQGMGLMDALRLNLAVLVGLTAAFTMRRHGEVARLDIFSLCEINGRCYIDVECEKKGSDGINPRIRRPIPRLLYDGLNLQRKFTLRLRAIDSQNHVRTDDRLWKVLALQCGNKNLLFSPCASTINESLDMFCDWIRVPLDLNGARWYLRLHECRRFGALSFFRLSGQENTLPTLSWFLGHSDISHTWRYIKEDLTGSEISEIEAAMAIEAVMTYQAEGADKGVIDLRKILQRHFNADRLDLIATEDIEEFLELKHREGLFTVFPRSIITADGQQTVIVIQLTRVPYATIDEG